MLIAFSIVVSRKEDRYARCCFVGGAHVVDGTLLLDEDGGVEVFDGGITALHVGDRHLRRKAGMKRALRLHLGQPLRFGCVQEIELLYFAVGGVAAVELLREQRAIGRGILASGGTVLAHSGKAVGRDRIGGLNHGELRRARAAEGLAGEISRCTAVHGDRGCFPCRTRCARRVGVERDAHARGLAKHIGDIHIFESMERRLPCCLTEKCVMLFFSMLYCVSRVVS